ncbi:unnamed protein product [Allacma fusca]|uniref:Uncharacterized protein n=1 Tax=Allacma fusca TaxID=39272 RepID=A0A8J2JWD7_9HEXA|nr:unnamed protein product [Allacma fusca]
MKSVLASVWILVYIAKIVVALVVKAAEGSPPTPGPPIDGGPCSPAWGHCQFPDDCCSSWCNHGDNICIGGEVPG